MNENTTADIEGLRLHIGGLVLDLFQMRGVAIAAQQALATAEKELANIKAKLAEKENPSQP